MIFQLFAPTERDSELKPHPVELKGAIQVNMSPKRGLVANIGLLRFKEVLQSA